MNSSIVCGLHRTAHLLWDIESKQLCPNNKCLPSEETQKLVWVIQARTGNTHWILAVVIILDLTLLLIHFFNHTNSGYR